MTRIITCLVSLISLNAFATMIEGINPELNFDPNIEMKSSFTSPRLNVVIENYYFPDGPQRDKFEHALELLDEIMNSEEFKRRVISYVREVNGEWVNSYQKSYLWYNRDEVLSPEDVYNVLMEGNEKMRPSTLAEMNLNSYVKVCRWWEKWSTWCRKVIGSTAPSKSKWIKLNWKFYRKYEVNNMVANMVHEWIHLLGFLHGKDRMREEVPYVVGAIAGQLAAEIIEFGHPLSVIE